MSRILKNVHASAKRLHEAGYMNDATLRQFDRLCLPPLACAYWQTLISGALGLFLLAAAFVFLFS